MPFHESPRFYPQAYKKTRKNNIKRYKNQLLRFFRLNSFKKTRKSYKRYALKVPGSSVYQPKFSYKQLLFTYLGSFLGIAALAYITVETNYPLIAGPFGATAVLLFAVSDSPLAQPRNVLGGNLIGGIIGIAALQLFGTQPWVMAIAVATAIYLMQLTKTLHPPGGAVALVAVMSNASWNFLLTPVLAGSVVILLCTYVFNNWISGRQYPQHWL